MDGGFPYGDVIAFAAIAAFIILRYRAMLGEKSGRDPTEVKARPLQEFERVIQLPNREKAKAVEKAAEKDYGPLTETYTAMRALDRQFTPEEFLQGAKAAFEMVLEAFSKADHETLQMLLSPVIYRNFKESLTQLDAQKRTHQSTLIAINTAEVADATLEGSVAKLAVVFVTEQVILQRDASGAVVEGDPSHQQVVEDRWVFERNMTSGDPAWKIVET